MNAIKVLVNKAKNGKASFDVVTKSKTTSISPSEMKNLILQLQGAYKVYELSLEDFNNDNKGDTNGI